MFESDNPSNEKSILACLCWACCNSL